MTSRAVGFLPMPTASGEGQGMDECDVMFLAGMVFGVVCFLAGQVLVAVWRR